MSRPGVEAHPQIFGVIKERGVVTPGTVSTSVPDTARMCVPSAESLRIGASLVMILLVASRFSPQFGGGTDYDGTTFRAGPTIEKWSDA